MRIPFPNAKLCEGAWNEALDSLRAALRQAAFAETASNPFASPLPCPLDGLKRGATILRIF